MGDLFPLSDYMIRVLAMLGTWLAGVGSLAAVITSLWLARRTERPHLAAKVHMKDFRDADSHFQGQWVFSIVNTGFRPLMVEKLGWRWRASLCGHIHWEAFVDGLPKTLEPGDHASIETDFAFNDIVQLLQSRKRVSVVVDTAIGQVTERVHPSLRRYLRGYGERIPLQPHSVVESDPSEGPKAKRNERDSGPGGGEGEY